MPSVEIPNSGLPLNSRHEDSKSGVGGPAAFSLTLADAVIEDMIKCVENGKTIQLSFGRNPTLLYGSKAQHLLVSNEDPFTTELYRTEFNTPNSNATSDPSSDEMAPPSHFITRVNRRQLVPTTRKATGKPSHVAAEPVDAAIEALKAGMDEEMSKKKGSSAKILQRDPPSTTAKKGAAKPAANNSRFLAQNKKGFGNEIARSIPTSPALSGVGSPSLAPTSVPLSQRKAEKDKEVRGWILHYLAVDKAKEEDIWDFFSSRTEHSRDDFKTALDKVADYDSSNQTWSLRGKAFKELDPWAFEYASQEDRQKAIEHAIKAFDKMRLHTSEPEWQKLMPESERGQGKILSKLTAKIAEKSSAPRGKALKSPGHDTNTETDEDKLLGDSLTARNGGGGEAMSRSASSSSATKSKKISENEAQAKRLLGKPGKAKAVGKSSPATKTSPAKKPAAKKDKEDASRIKSSQFVNESDEEDDYLLPDSTKKVVTSSAAPKSFATAATSIGKPPVKRGRTDDITDTKAAQPAVKKARKDDGASTPLLNGNTSKHRTSDASQFSQNSQSSRSTAPSTVKTKNSLAQKSSPLASSPPTNASDIDDEDPYHTSSSTSPYTSNVNPLKRKAAADTTNARVVKKAANGIRQHPPKSASTSSASPASVNGNANPSQEVSDEVMELADQFKSFYTTYVRLHKRLENSPNPSEKEIQDLNAMHSKLQKMKEKIFSSVSDQ